MRPAILVIILSSALALTVGGVVGDIVNQKLTLVSQTLASVSHAVR